ncbi:MAG: DivIVA domain-containing protein [Ruminococcaceae bacterium]|nr:DivIVA domain-containing protein [Oscillospiraceae bacterium]
MMLPNQITLQTFTQTAKGGYKAVEVDAFIQRVYQSYNKLYNDNKALCEKLDEILPVIDEYNKRKSSIADALIWAKSTAEKNIEEAKGIADKLVSEATEKADRLCEEKKAEADAYYEEKTSEAEKKAATAKAELESIKKQADSFSEQYTQKINVKAQQLVEQANEKAAAIVADAYADAKAAKEKAESTLNEANRELNALKAEAAKIKNELLALVGLAQQAAEEVANRIFEPVEADEGTEDEAVEAPVIDVNEIEAFTLEGIEPELPAENEEKPVQISEEAPGQPEFVRFFDTKLPEVNDLLSEIFTAVNEQNPQRAKGEEENSFRFTNIFDDPADRGDTRIFNPKA